MDYEVVWSGAVVKARAVSEQKPDPCPGPSVKPRRVAKRGDQRIPRTTQMARVLAQMKTGEIVTRNTLVQRTGLLPLQVYLSLRELIADGRVEQAETIYFPPTKHGGPRYQFQFRRVA